LAYLFKNKFFENNKTRMWLILLEAGLALALLLGIVFWTMRGKK